MRVQISGVNTTTKKKNGVVVATYRYHRATGARLKAEPGTPEFLAEYAAAEANISKSKEGDLAALIRDFQQSIVWKKRAESTKKEYIRIFKFWEGKYGSCPLDALADKKFRKAVLDWHAKFAETKPREADNRVAVLARVLSWAARDSDLKANVLDTFTRAYEGDRSDKIWLPEHVEAFMAVANDEMRLALVLALHTGQRQGDIRKMAWSNYDGTHLKVRQGKSQRGDKPGRLVRIKCTNALKATLDALPRRSPLIMPTKTGRAFQKRYLARQWEETATTAGVTGLNFHDLRGTTVTLLFEAGCTIGEIVDVTGHSVRTAQDILDKYLARTGRMADSAIAKFENVVGTYLANQPANRTVAGSAK